MAQIAWVQRVKYLARDQTVADFDLEKAKSALPSLLALVSKKEDVAKVPSFLKSIGIHFVIVPHLPHIVIPIDKANFLLRLILLEISSFEEIGYFLNSL